MAHGGEMLIDCGMFSRLLKKSSQPAPSVVYCENRRQPPPNLPLVRGRDWIFISARVGRRPINNSPARRERTNGRKPAFTQGVEADLPANAIGNPFFNTLLGTLRMMVEPDAFQARGTHRIEHVT